jgi:hypothetical protein
VSFSSFLLFFFFFCALPVDFLPKKASATTSSTAAASTGGVSTATDGLSILDKTVIAKHVFHLNHQYNPPLTQQQPLNPLQNRRTRQVANQFTVSSRVTGASTTANSTSTSGLNALLHGDDGESFFDFPNQAVQNNLIGVVVLAPNKNFFWGWKRFSTHRRRCSRCGCELTYSEPAFKRCIFQS